MKEMFKSKCVTACLAVFAAAAVVGTSGCVSDKVIAASQECTLMQAEVRIAELNALGSKMDNKDMIINMLATKLAGDPCSDMLIAEINGKNKLLNAVTLGGVAVLPQYFNYKKDKELYKALSGQNRTSNVGIDIRAETGSTSEGGGTGDITTNISTGGDVNTGTINHNDIDKGTLDGDVYDEDNTNVESDGLL